jgi:hypothetical protein
MLKYISDVYEKWCVIEKCDLNWFEGFDCELDLNYGNIDWWIDVLNCWWIYIESMC